MKQIKLLLSVLMCAILLSSCKTKKETTIGYGFLCSENLFEFVDITATYTTDKGEEISTVLSPSTMEVYRESGIDTDNILESKLGKVYAWQQINEYDDKVTGKLTISYQKKEGIDYNVYNGQYLIILNHPYLSLSYAEGSVSFGSVSVETSVNVSLGSMVKNNIEVIEGDKLEAYIDKLVNTPLVK